MSTRGCVAIKKERTWEGVYNHFDSYPSGLGQDLWDYLQGKDLKEFAEELLNFGDWREYLNGGICEYCGKKLGQPCNISVSNIDLVDRIGYPDPESKYHDHSNPDEPSMTPKNSDFLFIEWKYVVDVKNKLILVHDSVEVSGKFRGKKSEEGYQEPLYKLRLLWTWKISGKKPNFKKLEQELWDKDE